jgi:tRNA (adenine22-N1)-methyltransferase
MELSKRLQRVIDLMPPMDTICDVGCDHGYVAITFIQKGTAQHVIAMDVNAGPLEQAKKNAAMYGVTDKLDFRLSDGLLKVIPGEADAFLCAGMGGRLMVRIMSDGKDVMAKMKGAVLQPQSELYLVRKHIYEMGWHIVKEDMVFEEDSDTPAKGIYYPMMYIEPGKESMPDDVSLTYGPLLLEQKHPVLRKFLEFSLKLKEGLVARLQAQASGEQAQVRIQELQGEISVIKGLLS